MPKSERVYQLKVTLKGIRPSVCLRVLVADSTTLDRLHFILQVVMGWTDSHLHQFEKGRQVCGVPDPEACDVNTINLMLSRLQK